MGNKSSILSVIGEVEKIIGYVFIDKDNIILALTHSSYTNETKKDIINTMGNNERLEFLGDSILGICISEYLYSNYENLTEGEMTKLRANIVCEASLEKVGKMLGLGRFLLLSKGEEQTGGRNRSSIISDAYEALIGAIFLDGGFEIVKEFVFKNMRNQIKRAIEGNIYIDYKTKLQEQIQKDGLQKIEYKVINESGPDHKKVFKSCVFINGSNIGEGEDKSKKASEQKAAKKALNKLN